MQNKAAKRHALWYSTHSTVRNERKRSSTISGKWKCAWEDSMQVTIGPFAVSLIARILIEFQVSSQTKLAAIVWQLIASRISSSMSLSTHDLATIKKSSREYFVTIIIQRMCGKRSFKAQENWFSRETTKLQIYER